MCSQRMPQIAKDPGPKQERFSGDNNGKPHRRNLLNIEVEHGRRKDKEADHIGEEHGVEEIASLALIVDSTGWAIRIYAEQ